MPNPTRGGGRKRSAGPSTGTSTGIDPNVAGALAYILGLITGVLFFVLEKENRFVRFHAAQSIIVSVLFIIISIGLSMLSGLLAFVPLVGWLAALLVTFGVALAGFALWVFLMWQAYQGEEFEVPVAGEIARRMSG